MSGHTLRWPSTAGERFAPGCLDRLLGEPVVIRHPACAKQPRAVLAGYTVADDGSFIDLELEDTGDRTEP